VRERAPQVRDDIAGVLTEFAQRMTRKV
jgi:hypothetical protein